MRIQKMIVCLLALMLMLLPLAVCGCTDGGAETGTESSAPVGEEGEEQAPSQNQEKEERPDKTPSESNPEGSNPENEVPKEEQPEEDQPPEGGKPEGSDKPVVELPFVPHE